MAILFKKTRILENQIDEFLDAVSQGGIVFKQGINDYLDGRTEYFKERLVLISKLENKAEVISGEKSKTNCIRIHSFPSIGEMYWDFWKTWTM